MSSRVFSYKTPSVTCVRAMLDLAKPESSDPEKIK